MTRIINAFIQSLRYKDVLIFEAPALVGLAFSIPGLSLATLLTTLAFVPAGFLLMAHIFYFNDWADSAVDSNVVEKSQQIHMSYGVTTQELLILSILLGAAGLVAFAFISPALFLIALSILLLGVWYSFPHPRFKGKGIPLLSSVLHIAGAVLTFLLGYAVFSPLNIRGLWIGGYFAFLLTAGHLFQELQDFAGDQIHNVSTNAVRFGPAAIFLSAFSLFAGSFVYLYGLAQAGLVPTVLKYLVLFLPIFVVMGVKAFRAGINHTEMQRFRGRYRILFGIIVAIMAGVTVLHR